MQHSVWKGRRRLLQSIDSMLRHATFPGNELTSDEREFRISHDKMIVALAMNWLQCCLSNNGRSNADDVSCGAKTAEDANKK